MDQPQETPLDFTENVATRLDLGLPVDLSSESDSLAAPHATELPADRAPRRRSRRPATGARIHLRRVIASFVVLAVTAAVAGFATFATFTSSSSGSHQTTAGTVTVVLGATGSVSNRLNVNVSGMAPTDTAQRTVDIINSSSLALASILLTTTAPVTSSLLDSDATNGLQVVIDKCSVPWTEAGVSPAYTYTCSGSTISVLASRAVIGSNLPLSNMTTVAAGGTDHLRLTLTLPTTAGNTFQGITSTINFQFTGTQRVGTNV